MDGGPGKTADGAGVPTGGASGEVAPGFEPVRAAFEENFARRGDVGAACCLYADGRKVVDLWGGLADAKRGRDWVADTLTLVYSATKGVTAIVAHLMAQQGRLDLDAPVTEYWPEFGAEGKGDTTVRWLLSHRAGLPTIDRPLTPEQALAWDPAVEALAAQAPSWVPGSKHGYHALTYGWLVGEVVRRATGRRVDQILSDDVCRPLDLELWIGLPPALEDRVSRLIAPTPLDEASAASLPAEAARRLRTMRDPSSLAFRSQNVTTPPFNFNSPQVHAGLLPAGNAIATARSLARLYAATIGEVDGVRLLDQATVADGTKEQSSGPDEVLLVKTRFGTGFCLSSSFTPMLGPHSFGHSGSGGSLTFADPELGIAFAYVMNQMRQTFSEDPRTRSLIDAVRAVVRR